MGVCASVDLGSSVTKGWADDGSGDVRANFPSVVVRAERGHKRAIGLQVGKETLWYLVGRDAMLAQRKQDTRPQQGAEYHGSPTQRVLTCALLRELGVHRRGGVAKMAMGLPYVLTRDEHALGHMTEFCRTFRWLDADGEHEVRPGEVYLPAQGSGALIKYLREHREHEARLVLVVDIGGQTSDCVATELGTLVDGCSQSIGVNVYGFFRQLVTLIEAQPYAIERQWDYHDVMERIRNELWNVRGEDGKVMNIRPQVDQTRMRWTQMLQDAVRDVMGTRWPDIERIVLTGGGAALVDTNEWRAPITVMDDMANVHGQHLALKGEA